MHEGIQSEVISTTRFDEYSALSITYLGRIDTTRAIKIKAEEKCPNIKTRVYDRKAIGWNRISDIIGCQSKQVIHVQITLFMV